MTHKAPCPCQSNRPFSLCCNPFLSGEKTAQTAEELMRSRYTAYTARDTRYLLQTWHPATKPKQIDHNAQPNWSELIIKKTEAGSINDSKGAVEFIAIAQTTASQRITLHETSRFQKENGEWVYVDGEIEAPQALKKIGRNAPCPCESGKKFKKCCSQ